MFPPWLKVAASGSTPPIRTSGRPSTGQRAAIAEGAEGKTVPQQSQQRQIGLAHSSHVTMRSPGHSHRPEDRHRMWALPSMISGYCCQSIDNHRPWRAQYGRSASRPAFEGHGIASSGPNIATGKRYRIRDTPAPRSRRQPEQQCGIITIERPPCRRPVHQYELPWSQVQALCNMELRWWVATPHTRPP